MCLRACVCWIGINDKLMKREVEYERKGRSHGKVVICAPDVCSHTINQALGGGTVLNITHSFCFIYLFIFSTFLILASVLSQ